MGFAVVYDACVLYPAPLRDFLMWAATSELFAAKWTEQIHSEWSSNLLKRRPELQGHLPRTIELMNNAVPDCLVENYEGLIPGLSLPDPDDRHVLAAAIKSGAQLIITFNLRDFPQTALEPYGIEAVHPDNFLVQQFDLHEAKLLQAAKKHRASLTKPPQSVEAYLETLASNGLVVTVDRLWDFRDSI